MLKSIVIQNDPIKWETDESSIIYAEKDEILKSLKLLQIKNKLSRDRRQSQTQL